MNAQYPDHPAASLMPNMTEEEFQALKADIKQHGLREPILIFNGQVVDGRHRLRACRELGIKPLIKEMTCQEQDLPGLVRSLNFHRRHLTREQKQTIIRQQLKETPDKSDRQIAKDLGVSDKTVGSARKVLESTAEIPQFDRTVGTDGKARKRPAKPAPKATSPEPENRVQEPPAATSEPHQPESVSLDEWLQQIIKPLSARAGHQVEKGIKRLLARLRDDFQRQLQEELNKRLEAKRSELETVIQEARSDREEADIMRRNVSAYMTEEEFRLVRGLLHPDRHQGPEQDRYNQAYQIFNRLRPMLNGVPKAVLRASGWSKPTKRSVTS